MKLSDILNTISIPLEHDKLKFSLVPMTTGMIERLNNIYGSERQEGETTREFSQRVTREQMSLLAEHFRDCVVEGEKKRVTPKWVTTEIPKVIMQNLVDWFVDGIVPEWAPGGDSGK